jgi:hypothetical protein
LGLCPCFIFRKTVVDIAKKYIVSFIVSNYAICMLQYRPSNSKHYNIFDQEVI